MKLYRIIFSVLALLSGIGIISAQEQDQELSLELGGLMFFRNNEFDSPQLKGYSLPGFRFRTNLLYKPTEWIELRGGIWMLHYWGANNYPKSTYLGIPSFTAVDTKAFHAVPYVSLEMSTPFDLSVILGDIHNRNGHGLIQQLYAPELQLTADPEAGAQLLYTNKWLDMDVWLDWRSFIYYDSPYQENFFAGMSAKLKYNSPDAPIHLYTPIQSLVEHRGGEIDTIKVGAVQTFDNFATGLGARININRPHLKAVKLELDALHSWEQTGGVWHNERGWAMYAHAGLEFNNCDAKLGYFASHNFNSVLGYHLWSVDSFSEPGLVLHNPQIIYAGITYQREWAKGFKLGTRLDWYQMLPCDGTNYLTNVDSHYGSKSSFSFEVTMSFTPSFMLKKFPPLH